VLEHRVDLVEAVLPRRRLGPVPTKGQSQPGDTEVGELAQVIPPTPVVSSGLGDIDVETGKIGRLESAENQA
jgi:hypothetical protein